MSLFRWLIFHRSLSFIQKLQKCKSVVFPLFIGVFGCFIQGAQGNTAPGHPRPPAAVNARSDRLVAPQPPLARAMSTDEPAGTAEPVEPAGHRKTPRIITIKNFQSSQKYLELAIWQLSRKKPFLIVQISNTHYR